MAGLGDLFKGLANEIFSKKGGDSTPIDPKIIAKMAENFKSTSDEIDRLNNVVNAYKTTLGKLAAAQTDLTEGTDEYAAAQEELRKKQEAYNTDRKTLAKKTSENEKAIAQAAKDNHIEASKLRNALEDNMYGVSQSFDETTSAGTKVKNIVKDLAGNLTGMGDITSLLTDFIEVDFTAAITMATKQILELNNALVNMARATGSVITSRVMGFDNTGNNMTQNNVGSAESLAGVNGLNVQELLEPLKAFSDGNILGGVNLKNQGAQLQDYGVEIGRINKLYGVSSAATQALARTLTEQYGKSISDTKDIMVQGSEVAKAAGINVGIFFENLEKVAGLQGSLFVKGGSEGLMKTAMALTKLGLSTDSLSKIKDAYGGFSELIDKQQKAVALGLSNIGSAQGSIFAKVQNGDYEGAIKMQQFAAAKDVSRGMYSTNGMINTQGHSALASSGYSDEEQKSVQRIINMQKSLGISFEALSDETKLTSEQLIKKRKYESDNMTLQEKMLMLWAKVKATLIDPLASVIGPVISFAIDTLGAAFSTLYAILKPVIWVFQIFGQALSELASGFQTAYLEIGNFFSDLGKAFGFDSKAFGEGIVGIGAILRRIFEVLIIWKSFSMAQSIGKGLTGMFGNLGSGLGRMGRIAGGIIPEGVKASVLGKQFMGQGFMGSPVTGTRVGGLLGEGSILGGAARSTGSFLGRAGKLIPGGLSGVAGRVGGGMGISMIGGMAGDLIKGDAAEGSGRARLGDTVSMASTGAAIGSMLLPGVGTIIGGLAGALYANKDALVEGFDKLFTPLDSMSDSMIKQAKQDADAKIGSMGSGSSASNLENVQKIMQGRILDNKLAEQSAKENMVNSNDRSQTPIQVHVHSVLKTEMGYYKSKITGKG